MDEEDHGLNENTLLSRENNLSSDHAGRNIKKTNGERQYNFLSRPHFGE